MAIEFLGYKLYPTFLVSKNKIIAYSLHFSLQKSLEHLNKIVRYHKLKGKIAISKNLERELILNLLKEKKTIKPKFNLYQGREIYEFLYENSHRLFYYSELTRKFKISIFKLISLLKHNPMLIIIPCHHVIGKNSLGGYTPLGKEFKEKLITFEGFRITN